jgi:hypothetical protein
MSRLLFFLTISVGVASMACSSHCPVLLEPAFDVTVLDPSGASLCNATVTVAGTDNVTLQSLPEADGGCTYREATMVRPGTYTVTASAPAHQAASKSNVIITADTCGQDSIAQLTLTLPIGQ